MVSGKVFLHLLVDALINFFIGAENIHRVFMINHFFQHKRRDIEGDDVGIRYDIAIRGNQIVDIKVIGSLEARSVLSR